jgi:ABC-type oligopeptide transport system substrate-binding subunit
MKFRNLILVIMLTVFSITLGACSKSPTESNSKSNPFKPTDDNNSDNPNNPDNPDYPDENCDIECYSYYDDYGDIVVECFEICD